MDAGIHQHDDRWPRRAAHSRPARERSRRHTHGRERHREGKISSEGMADVAEGTMKPISEERIRETFGYYEGSQVQRSGDGWVVLMPSGRTVNIHPYHIDFRGITKRLPGEAEKDRDDLQFELMTLAVDVWGLVSLISYHGEHKDEGFRLWVYAKAYKLPVEGAWWPFSTTQAQKYFENDAAKVRLVIGGYRISLPEGKSVLIGLSCGEMIITKGRGGAEMYASSLKLLQGLQDRAYVSGSYSF